MAYMLTNGNFSKFLNGFLVITGLCILAPKSVLADNAPAEDNRAFKSFIYYQPKAAQFPSDLSQTVKQIEDANSALAQKKADAAESSFRAAVTSSQQLARTVNRNFQDQVYFLQGLAYEGLKNPAEALKSYNKSLAIRPTNMLAMFRHAYMLKQTGNCEKAIPELKEVAWQVRTQSFEMDFLTGECLVTMKRPEEALKTYQIAYQKNPNFLPLLREMIAIRTDLLNMTPDPKKRAVIQTQLENDLRSVVRQDPADRKSALTLARLMLQVDDTLVESGKLAAAETLAKKIAEDSGYQDDVAVRLLSQAQLKRGDSAAAEDTLNKGLAKQPNSSELQAAKQQLEIDKSIKLNGESPDTNPRG